MSDKSTETTQNILARLEQEMKLESVFINDSSPKSRRVKKQMVKVKKSFIELICQLDDLNDLKEREGK